MSDFIKDAQERMDKAVEATKHRFTGIRAGRASIAMLDGIKVEQYGSMMPLNQVANVSAPEARVLTIDPWDKSVIKAIEKAIIVSDLGLTPNNDGKIIRLVIPELTAERRKEYVKLAKKEAEEGKIAVRKIRQDINGNLYNYYNLFENTVVQNGLVFPKEGKVTIMLFNNNSELVYTFNDTVEKTPKYIKSDELKSGKLNEHPFTEIGNILNQSTEKPTNNDSFIANMIVVYNNKHFNIKFPYPAMYPNLISVVAAS